MRVFLGTLAAMLALAAGAASGAAAQTSLQTQLGPLMSDIGSSSGAYVVDMTTGQTLYAVAQDTGRLPASVEKIYTTSTALLRLGPTATFTTSILGVGSRNPEGVWDGTLYLRGGGDPTFGAVGFDHSWYGTGATMRTLIAALLKATGIKGVDGSIVADQSYFDLRRGTPATGFAANLEVEGELGGLTYDGGFTSPQGTALQARPALYAAQQLAGGLRAWGVKLGPHFPVSVGRTPPGATLLASVQSPPLSTLVALTNTPSDNYFAETLLKDLGARLGGAGTTAAGAAVVRSELQTKFGITPRLNDGSGLSRYDSTSPSQVVTVLEAMANNRAFVDSLAVGGETGTLQDEMNGTIGQGNCRGKTGTLHDVANLAGYCQARDGHTLVFAFLANGLTDPDYVHEIEADMAVKLAGYDG
ncbi:MAG TPA: D-alanyl-D-alanine carboxypeptidase/D-alanyl-D-alanine-endopeptidase [Solirubrobacteraceae bacterium]|nr:D-alanyl-D-alanine carboxypeptidase/D-alanyl-D-alanine-endopeptidase [Solirubrobacteraceae bacterium]